MVAFLRFDDLERRSETVEKVTHVLVRVQDVKTFDGEPYEIYHVDCFKSDGTLSKFDEVMDVMIE